jgi:hypothetical protein
MLADLNAVKLQDNYKTTDQVGQDLRYPHNGVLTLHAKNLAAAPPSTSALNLRLNLIDA